MIKRTNRCQILIFSLLSIFFTTILIIRFAHSCPYKCFQKLMEIWIHNHPSTIQTGTHVFQKLSSLVKVCHDIFFAIRIRNKKMEFFKKKSSRLPSRQHKIKSIPKTVMSGNTKFLQRGCVVVNCIPRKKSAAPPFSNYMGSNHVPRNACYNIGYLICTQLN